MKDKKSKPVQIAALEEFGELPSSVIAAQCNVTGDGFDGQVVLLPSNRRWVYVATIPADVPDELVHQVVRAFVNKMVVHDALGDEGSSTDAAGLNETAPDQLDCAQRKLLG